uniref:tetratricopeptide repeat protein n=1 Tax=uncultured Brachyspira sp. TaxID=221953 RepID=UPI00258A1BFB
YEEAIEDFDKAIKLNPDNTDAYNNRGFTKENLGLYEEAFKDYKKALELDPNNKYAMSNIENLKKEHGLK